jgi:hypothetical protein
MLSVPVLALGLAACSGRSDSAPTVTRTVQPSSSASNSATTPAATSDSASPSESASATAAPTTSEAPKKPVRITWVQVNRDNEPGYMESERLSIPTLENVPKKVQNAFNTQVSRKVGALRDQFLEIDAGQSYSDAYTEPSFIKTRSNGSAIYNKKYASVIVQMDGAARGDGHITGTAFGITMDVTTGNPVSLDNFVGISKLQLATLQQRELKKVLAQKNMADDPWHVLDGSGPNAWMVSDKGITFRYYAVFEGGWDYTITLPWSDVRG